MKSEKLIPNKRYRNVIVDGCKFDWVRLVQKPVQMMTAKKVGHVIKILVLVCVLSLTTMGCDPILTGIGIGAGGSEALNVYEEGLEVKKVELAQLYDEAIARMQNAADPNELRFETEKAQQIQIARAANLGALTVIQEFKGKSTSEKEEGYLNLLHGLIPIALGYAGNEMRKRLASEKKRHADKQGRELSLRQLATMNEKDITAPVVKEKMYKAIGDARRG